MRRRLIYLVAALSLLLCAAALTLCFRSYWRYDSLALVDNTVEQEGDHGVLWRSYTVDSGRGILRLAIEDGEMRIGSDEPWPAPRAAWEFRRFSDRLPPRCDLTQGRGWYGFSRGSDFGMGSGGSSSESYLTVPYWVLVTVSGVLGVPILRRGRRRATDAGCCRNCGYDLRATPERCPECGTPTNTLTVAVQHL